MRRYNLLFFGLIFLVNTAFGQVLIVDGQYQGKEIYIQNPFSPTGVGFCIFEVRVNGEVTTDEINSSAFKIDLALMSIGLGDSVLIELFHKGGCDPVVYNPEVLRPLSTFEVVDMEIVDDSLLKWSTRDEAGELAFLIEQFKWNKWVKVGTVQGKGKPQINDYEFKFVPVTGLNKFRVKQIDSTKNPRISKTVENRHDVPAITFSPLKTKTEIIFSRETMYEIFNLYGNLVGKGFGKKVNVSNLAKGTYYLNFDSSFGQTFEKK